MRSYNKDACFVASSKFVIWQRGPRIPFETKVSFDSCLSTERDLYFAPRRGAKYCGQHVCYVSVCPLAYLIKPHVQTSWNFLYTLPVVLDQSSYDDNPIRYVHPVLWMTSCFHILVHRVCGEAYGRGMSVSGRQRREGGASAFQPAPLCIVSCWVLTDIPWL